MMKIKNVLIAICFLIVSAVLAFIIFFSTNRFYLDSEYYNDNVISEINPAELKRLIATEKSFALFVYQPACVNSSNFELVLNEFQNDNQISFKKISFSNLIGTGIEEKIKYYPSFVIFKNGEIVDYLDSNSDEDTTAFKTVEGFKEWFTSYVNLKNKTNKRTQTTTTQSSNLSNIIVDLPEVKREEGKVNIYLFWGDGCPHCEHEQEFLESIEKEYGHLYNLYKFEVWENKTNANIMKVFSVEIGDEEKGGVPYTIIGGKTFRGFGTSTEESIKKAIEEESKKDFDIYFDIIKDKYKE